MGLRKLNSSSIAYAPLHTFSYSAQQYGNLDAYGEVL
jgi:hypothetical protein